MTRWSWIRAGLPLALALGVTFGSPAALAQGTDRALAEELFRQGQALMQEKRYSEACPKLAESQRLDPGTGTLLNLAVCHESQGKLATAWTEYSEVVTLARRDNRPDRVAYAEERLRAIEPKLARLTLELPPANDVPGLVIKLDGAVVGRPALGVAVPVDPGTHHVQAEAPGKKTWRATVDIAQGPSQKTVSLPVLEDAPTAEPTAASSAPEAADAGPRDEPGAGGTQRIIAYALGGAGVVGVGIGAVFGLSAISKNEQSNDEGCDGNRCSPAAAELRRDAQSLGNISTAAFAVGGALLAAGVVVYFTAPAARPDENASARLSFGLGTARFEASF